MKFNFIQTQRLQKNFKRTPTNKISNENLCDKQFQKQITEIYFFTNIVFMTVFESLNLIEMINLLAKDVGYRNII